MTNGSDIADFNYYLDYVECNGCQRKFTNCIRDSGDETKRFCMTCYNHRFGLDATMNIMEQITNLDAYCWETPANEIPREIKAKLDWVSKDKKHHP